MELENSMKNAEIITLKSQMNPYFLGSSLNSISNLAVIEDAPRTNEMITLFAEFIRYNLTTKNAINISEEIENVERYLKIQKVKLGDQLNYSIELAENLLTQKIPCFIILPFVERAVFYGVAQKHESGTVNIAGFYEGNDVIIRVEDDGYGLSEKEIAQMFKPYKGGYEGDFILAGITSSRHRLMASFGSEYDVVIENAPGKGTKSLIKYPKAFEDRGI